MLDIKQLSRTLVPLVYGGIIWVLTQVNFAPTGEEEQIITAGVSVVITGFIYTVIAVLERRFPWVGALIGGIGSPDSYSKDDDPYIPSEEDEETFDDSPHAEDSKELEEVEYSDENQDSSGILEDERLSRELQGALGELHGRLLVMEHLLMEDSEEKED